MTSDPLLKCIQERIHNLREEYSHILQLEVSLSQGTSLNEDQKRLLGSKPTILDVLHSLELLEKRSLSKEKESPSMNEKSKERRVRERYLCICNGIEILCLDLKDELKKCSNDLQPLPKIPLNPDAYNYMGCPVIKEDSDVSCFLYAGDPFKGYSSLKTYHLSLVEGVLSVVERDTNNIEPPNKPNFYPIPDTIWSKISVFESFNPARPIRTLSPVCFPCHHIIVADRIYANDISKKYFGVCDSTSCRWELHTYPYSYYHIFSLGHVAELLTCGFGKCIGKFQHAEESIDPLYVVIAIGRDGLCLEYAAAAYIVTPAGEVLCYQRLPLFFGGFMHPYHGLFGPQQGTLICVDEESKTFCAIVLGETQFPGQQRFLFVSTFTVQECPYAAAGSFFYSVRAQKRDQNHRSPYAAVEKYFVKVEVKEWHVYELNEADMSERSPFVTACFLSSSEQISAPQMTLRRCSTQSMESSHIPATTSEAKEWLRKHIRRWLRLLKWELKSIKSLESGEKSLGKYELHRKSVLCTLIQELNEIIGLKRSTNAEHGVCCESVISRRWERGRYLCVSYGFHIFCLDLKQSSRREISSYEEKDELQIKSLPVISRVKHLEEEIPIPVSMGFFKVNSNVYMVGGQEFHGFSNTPTSLWDLKLFDFLYRRYGMQGSSRDTYHLSLARDVDSSSLSLHECSLIGPLNEPKIWPIIERIGDKIHVIESLPLAFRNHYDHIPPGHRPSHEVLDLKDLGHGWIKLPPVCPHGDNMYIWNHLVVGDLLYASSLTTQFRDAAVFDSSTNTWEPQDSKASRSKLCGGYQPRLTSRPCSVNHVSQILSFGYGRCVTKSSHGDVYVVIALGFDVNMEMMAEAYLVTSRGQILCFQPLPHFFQDFDCPFQASEGRIIQVDDSEDGEETVMCAVLHGITYDTSEHFLFISTFTVEEDADANRVVQHLLSRTSDKEDHVSKLPYAVEEVFVKVVVKDVYIYKKEDVYQEEDHNVTGVSACFL